jgi:hypothetical protein
MGRSDSAKADLREKVWVEKVDHTTDPPTRVERVELLNGAVVGVETPGEDGKYADERDEAGQEAGAGEAAGQPREAGDVQGQDGDEGLNARLKLIAQLGRQDPFKVIGAVAKAAAQAGVPLEDALRFMSALAMELVPRRPQGPSGRHH